MPNIYHWAVVVGIDQYTAFTRLNCARRDAEAFCDWLRAGEGGDVPPANVRFVPLTLSPNLTAAQAEPKLDQIFDAIQEIFEEVRQAVKVSSQTWQQTRLYLYFAGHGIAPEAEDAALLAADANLRNLGKHVSCQKVRDFLIDCRMFHELVIFADCCREDMRRRVRAAFPPWTFENELGQRTTRVFLAYAAEFGSLAYEEQYGPLEERRGYFTRCLLEALNNRNELGEKMSGSDLRKRLKGLLANVSSLPQSPESGLNAVVVGPDYEDISFGVTSKTPEYRVDIQAEDAITHVRFFSGSGEMKAEVRRDAGKDFMVRLGMGLHEWEISKDGHAYERGSAPVSIVPGCNLVTLP